MTAIELKELLKQWGLPYGFSYQEKLMFTLLIYIVIQTLYSVNQITGG